MGVFFFFYPKHLLAAELARRAFVALRGRRPARTQIRVDEIDDRRNLLVAVYDADTSASLYAPCSDGEGGFFYASTELLPSGRKRRSLFLELSRGQLSRIQKKRADWGAAGLVLPMRLRAAIRKRARLFAELVTTNDDEHDFDERTVKLFTELREISRKLNEYYLTQALAARRNAAKWSTNFSFAVDANDEWLDSFDALFSPQAKRRASLEPVFSSVNIRVNWRDVERDGRYDWGRVEKVLRDARQRNLKITLGPLVRWGSDLPEHLRAPNVSAEQLQREFERYLSSAIDSVGPYVSRWIVATNVENVPNRPTFEFRLLAAIQAKKEIAARFPGAQIFLGFEQAFGDYARFDTDQLIPPVELAAQLSKGRAFHGYYVEANFGLTPGTTAPRDPMELHRFFERWSIGGVPLAVAFSCPSESPAGSPNRADSNRLLTASPFGEERKRRFFTRESRAEAKPLEELLWSPQMQQETARRFYSTALTRRAVDEIIWTRWQDAPQMSYNEYASTTNVFYGDSEETTSVPSNNAPISDVYDEVDEVGDELGDVEFEEEKYDEVDLASDESSFREVSCSSEIESPENFTPTSGLLGVDKKPKPTLYKLAAIRRAYLHEE